MATLDLTAATNVLVGKPAKPIAKRLQKLISAILGDLPEVREAHMLEVFAIGIMQAPRNVLFVVVEPDTAIAQISERLDSSLRTILKRRERLDLWPVGSDHRLIATVREADCLVGWRD